MSTDTSTNGKLREKYKGMTKRYLKKLSSKLGSNLKDPGSWYSNQLPPNELDKLVGITNTGNNTKVVVILIQNTLIFPLYNWEFR